MTSETIDLKSLIHQHPTFLDEKTALLVTKIATATRLSIRVAALVAEIILETAKYSTSTTMTLSRQALISAITSARNYRSEKFNKALTQNEDDRFLKVLDSCTNLGIYFVHHSFTLAELFAMSGFHLFSTSVKSGLWTAEESVRVLDKLFGSNETSRALASIVVLVKKEMFEDEEFNLSHLSGSHMLSSIAKALAAFACLQTITHQRHSKQLTMTCLYEGVVPLSSLSKESQPKYLMEESMTKSISENSTFDTKSSIFQHLTPEIPSMDLISSNHVNMMPKVRARRTKSFSSLPRLPGTATTEFSTGLVELLDQSNEIGLNGQGHVGEKVMVEGSLLSFAESNMDLNNLLSSDLNNFLTQDGCHTKSSPPVSPVPSFISINSECVEAKSEINFTDFVPNDTTLLSLITRFMRYSSAAYGSHFMRILGIGSWDDEEPHHPSHHINHHAFSRHTSTPLESILFSSFTNISNHFQTDFGGLLKPATLRPLVHYVTVDHGVKAIVLTCRGTLGISDALTDLTCDYSPVKIGNKTYLAHSGMLRSAQSLASPSSEVHAILKKALTTYPGYGLVMCGHSLGGGVVSLLALLWTERNELNPSGKALFSTSEASELPTGRFVHCFTYGVPSSLSLFGSEYCKGLVTSLINNDDIVPSLSLGILRDFKNVTTSLMSEQHLPRLIIKRALGIDKLTSLFPSSSTAKASNSSGTQTGVSGMDDWFWSLIKTMRADMQSEKLYPPGEVYIMNYKTSNATVSSQPSKLPSHLARSNSTPVPSSNAKISEPCLHVTLSRCEEVSKRFSELTFSRSMFGDHSPRSYEDNLIALTKSLDI